MNVRPVAPADAAQWRRMRLALWPDSVPDEIDQFFAVDPLFTGGLYVAASQRT